MEPVTGPFTRTKAASAVWSEETIWSRQKRPYDLVLPLVDKKCFWVSTAPGGIPAVTGAIGYNSLIESQRRDICKSAFNKAYARFLDKMGDSAGIGVDLAQYRQAQGMIGNRALQLVSFTRALLRRDLNGISEALRLPLEKTKAVIIGGKKERRNASQYATSRTLADLWLEFWFGAKPIVQDIYAFGEVLSAPLKATRIRASAVVPFNKTLDDLGLPATVVRKSKGLARVRLGADVEVINPNLRLMQQMGILNPAVVAVDLVPWSFVLGWFHNFQDYLSSFTDFAGLRLHKPYVVRHVEGLCIETWNSCTNCTPADKIVYNRTMHTYWFRQKEREALSSVPRPYWMWRGLNGLSPTRGLTAISLLTQMLPSLERRRGDPKDFGIKVRNPY